MNKLRLGKPDGRGTPIEDPQIMHDALQLLFEAEVEFPIKVEGAATLPYASRIQRLHLAEGFIVLKLVRPLPHEMPTGAVFRMIFAVEDQRFEGLISLRGRDGYLQYGFTLPPALIQADRRQHKRFPFRPRENAYLIAQDAGIPGMGVAGPLVNICMGGLALRVDRALRMDTGIRLPVNTALFERGKSFPRFRLQDLPLLHLLEGRTISAHATERGTELILGMSFAGMSTEEENALAQSLHFRERMFRGNQAPRSEGPVLPGGGLPRTKGPEEAAAAPPETEVQRRTARSPQETAVQVRLQRRSTRVVLVMADGPVRAATLERLRHHGFHRLETLEQLDQLKPLCLGGQRRALPGLVLADLALANSGDAEPLAAVRIIEHELAELAAIPTAILCEEVDPTLLLAQASTICFLSYPSGAADKWVESLDAMLPDLGE